ncbi:DUF6578 domain-containing protein [Kocuria sabuli]|uniref:DUF6578 domain-containing protein n=1 Tax=Kocuria sabuli TaxID=3071448 RepID=UPI0034D45663
MTIAVDLSEWEQQCCGEAFRVGSAVTWKLVARAPSTDSGLPLPLYREEHHGETPEHVPHLPVTGTVRAIEALHYAFDEGPNPGELTVRPSSELGVELDAVPGAGTQLPGCSTQHRLLTYRVRLEVADDAERPDCAPGEPGGEQTARHRAGASRRPSPQHLVPLAPAPPALRRAASGGRGGRASRRRCRPAQSCR